MPVSGNTRPISRAEREASSPTLPSLPAKKTVQDPPNADTFLPEAGAELLALWVQGEPPTHTPPPREDRHPSDTPSSQSNAAQTCSQTHCHMALPWHGEARKSRKMTALPETLRHVASEDHSLLLHPSNKDGETCPNSFVQLLCSPEELVDGKALKMVIILCNLQKCHLLSVYYGLGASFAQHLTSSLQPAHCPQLQMREFSLREGK